MKVKFFNLLLIITSLFGYLEWSGDSHAFLFQAEAEVFSKLFTDPASVLHPFTLLPMAGQIILLLTLFQNKPGKILTYIGIACLGLLLGFMFVIGIISVKYKIVLSTIPFLVVAFFTIRRYRNVNVMN
jgi:hypothetical protein